MTELKKDSYDFEDEMAVSGGDVTVERLLLQPNEEESEKQKRQYDRLSFWIFITVSFFVLIFIPLASGHFKEILVYFFIIWISIYTLLVFKENTAKISTWNKDHTYKKDNNLPLKKSSNIMERALRGMSVSQLLIEKKLRKILLEKIRRKKNIRKYRIKKQIDERDGLNKIVEDEDLTEFLTSSKDIHELAKNEEEKIKLFNKILENDFMSKQISNRGVDENYKNKISNILKKISDWEDS